MPQIRSEIPLARFTSLRLLDRLSRRRALVAYLTLQGMPQKDISYLISKLPEPIAGGSQGTVSTDFQQAMDDDWIKTALSPMFHPDLIQEIRDTVHLVRWLDLAERLKAKSGGKLKDVRVFFSGVPARGIIPRGKSAKFPAVLHRFARNAASYIEPQLHRTGMVGVAGGSTLAEVMETLTDIPAADRIRPKTSGPIKVIPVSCDPPAGSPEDVRIPSSTIAIELNRFLNGTTRPIPPLANIPPVVRNKEHIEDRIGWWEIFGGPKPLVNEVDTVLTSAGAFHAWKTLGASYNIITNRRVTSAEYLPVSSSGCAVASVIDLLV
jgi:hypothetical protein